MTGFSYYVSDEQIKAWQQVSVDDKLEWLEQTAQFLYEFQDEKAKAITHDFRNPTSCGYKAGNASPCTIT